MARRHGLPNAEKPDSADICFIPSGDYRSFLRERVRPRGGEIVDVAGERLGEHSGIENYTVGQRRGLPPRGGTEPLYVLGLDAATNTVIVGPEDDLRASGLIADELSFVSGEAPSELFEAQARIRYRSPPAPAVVQMRGRAAEVRFERPQRAVTPGQAVVFYDGDEVLGGGTITRSLTGRML